MAGKKETKKKINTRVSDKVGFTTKKIRNEEGPQTSGIHPTEKINRHVPPVIRALGRTRAGLQKNRPEKVAGGITSHEINKFTPHSRHKIDNLFAGRFHKKGKDLHAHTFGISHSSDHVHHITSAGVRAMKHVVNHQPSVSQDAYNKQLINAERFDQDGSIYAVNRPLDISSLGQGPLL